jgi:hypothetical protein
MSNVKNVQKGKPQGESKAKFVRRRPKESATEVAAAAKAAGFDISAAYVYNVRAYDKKRSAKKVAPAKPTPVKPVTSSKPTGRQTERADTPYHVNAILLAIVKQVGLAHVFEILEEIKVDNENVLAGRPRDSRTKG